MSRSTKKAIITSSPKIDKDQAHRQVRRRVKAELQKPEPDEFIINADTRDLQLEEWGTKFDFRFSEEGDFYPTKKDLDKSKRK